MKNRYDFLYLFDCTDANPNGDPDAGNMPRLDPETNHGLVTDVCLKRKIRNFVALSKGGAEDAETHQIYVHEKAVLSTSRKAAYDETGVKPVAQKEGVGIKDWICKHFYDVRTFGAVMSTKEYNAGQVRGAVQLSFSRSYDPIVTAEHSITRCAVETEKEAEKQQGDNRTMGRKFTIPYGLYRCQGFVNPFLAEQTGFSDEDLELLFASLENAFQFDQSAARPAGSMNPRGLLIFKHDSQLGSAPSHKLFDLVTVAKKEGVEVPRSFSDYDVTIDESAIPAGVTLIKRI